MARYIRTKILFLLLVGTLGFAVVADEGDEGATADTSQCQQQFQRDRENSDDDDSESRPLEICETIDVSTEFLYPRTIVISCPPGLPDDLEYGPFYRQPWSLLTTAPGVQADRLPRDGAIDPPHFNSPGTNSDQNVIRLDGFEITEDSSGEPSFELGMPTFERVEIALKGDSTDMSIPGLRIDLTSPTGGNIPHASARFLTGDGTDDRPHQSSVGELTLGGALRRDHLWIWAAASDTGSDHTAIGGQTVASDLAHAAGHLKFAAAGTVLVAAWHQGSVREAGHGAGPYRTPDATWDRDSDSQLWRLDIDHMATDSLILFGSYGVLDRRLDSLPLDQRLASERPRIVGTNSLGVTDGAPFAQTGRHETEEWRLDSGLFLDSPKASHELEIGFRQRQHAATDRWTAGGARWLEAATNFHLITEDDSNPQASHVATSWLDSSGQTDLKQTAGWLQDTLQIDRLTLVAGLRWDRQQGTSRVNTDIDTAILDYRQASADWQGFLPRLGLTLRLDAVGRHLLQASFARFTSRLGPAITARLPLAFPSYRIELSDSEEHRPRTTRVNVRPDLLAPNLSPEVTDELSLGFLHQARWNSIADLTVTYRRSHDLLERRTLVQDGNGAIRPAVAADWYQAGSLSGELPSGERYRVSVYDVSSDLELVPSGLWVNGDRRRESLAVSLSWRGSVHGWQTRGHVSWHDSRWHLGPEFRRFDDPTDNFGSGDKNGARAIELVPRDRLGPAEVAVDSRWSFHWSNSVVMPWDLRLGFTLAGREGHPQPYFRRVVRQVAGVAKVQLTPMDAVRSPDVFTLDARLAKEMMLGRYSLTLALEAFNLLGAEDVLRRELDLGVGRGGAVDETMTSRLWRLGVRLGWR